MPKKDCVGRVTEVRLVSFKLGLEDGRDDGGTLRLSEAQVDSGGGR